MKRILLLLSLLVAAMACSTSAPAPESDEIRSASAMLGGDRHVIDTTLELRGDLVRIAVTVGVGTDKFGFVRLSKPPPAHRGLLLLLPPRNGSAASYEWTDTGVPYAESFAAKLARAGYDVWSFSPRTSFVAPHACDAPGSCASAATWGMQTYVEDIHYVRSLMGVLHPTEKPFVGGMSLGTILGLASVDAHPLAYRGLIVWEGLLTSNDAAFRAGFVPVCAADQGSLASGRVLDDAFGAVTGTAYALASSAPTAPSPLPFFPGFNNAQTFVGLFAFPNPAVPIPARGFVIQVGNPPAATFAYTTIARVGKMITTGNHYESVALERDFDCSFAGSVTQFSDGLGAFKGPTFVLKAGLGFGDYVDATVSVLGSTDVTVRNDPAYGHGDHLVGSNYRADAVAPIKAWLDAHTP